MKFHIYDAFKPARRLALVGVLAGLTLAAGFSGCGGGGGGTAANNPAAAPGMIDGEQLYRVKTDVTPFYRYGPQQPNGPDLSLTKGTKLAMIRRSYGYSQVRAPDKQVGYVATEDLTAFTPDEMAAERAAEMAAANPVKKSSAIVGEYTIPPGAGSQEQLPEPEARPTPNPAMFRY